MAGRLRQINARGFTLIELVIVVGITAVITVTAMATFTNYWQTSMVKSGAQELASILNTARALAIRQNQTVTVNGGSGGTAGKFQVMIGTTPWTALTSDTNGWTGLNNSIIISAYPGASVQFTNLGAASPGGTYTVQNTTTSQTLSVIVAVSGRVSIGP
ncbi:MAG: GspH/FimT family pseudopilin [Candidatus Rokubacteria bacterium]|nr:GspH/FimT family pseudopilin [Candidatus Rokubacteria bacterium]MBI3825558.1 GspH/FimT family pseudopilin [Candidatus Rokubacteria bacterium]